MSQLLKKSFVVWGVLVTSMAAGGVLLIRQASGRPSRGKAPTPVESERVSSAPIHVEFAPSFEFAPLAVEGGVPPVVTALTWDMRSRSMGSPKTLSNGSGRLAKSGLRKSGVAIASGSTGTGAERLVSPGVPSSESPPAGLVGGARLAAEIKAHKRGVDRCAGKGLVPGGSVSAPAGKLSLSWVIRSDGSSSNLAVLQNTLGDSRLSKCVVDAVSRWRFTPPSADTSIQSTFMFL